MAVDLGQEQRKLAYVGCGLAATLPPLGVDLGALTALLWYLVHDTARQRNASLSADEAMTILRAAGPELAWSLLGGSGLKWLFLPLGMGVGSYFNVLAAQLAVKATHLYLDSGRRLRGNALRTELEEARRRSSRRAG
ncbi:MAG: hypothetical protein FJZ01_04515 [Candidatus Sericytochromatia bacterium]|nr:hypothetical protein [Candidatus Tanganyikabacteria bacterium]